MEKKIAAELDAHGLLATPKNPHPRVPDYTDLSKLTYLSCVIKESMRMHTVGFVTEACCKFTMELSHKCVRFNNWIQMYRNLTACCKCDVM